MFATMATSMLSVEKMQDQADYRLIFISVRRIESSSELGESIIYFGDCRVSRDPIPQSLIVGFFQTAFDSRKRPNQSSNNSESSSECLTSKLSVQCMRAD
jgi:hypothetical protein